MQTGAVFLKFLNHSCPVSSGVAVVVDSIEDFEKIEKIIIEAANEAKIPLLIGRLRYIEAYASTAVKLASKAFL